MQSYLPCREHTSYYHILAMSEDTNQSLCHNKTCGPSIIKHVTICQSGSHSQSLHCLPCRNIILSYTCHISIYLPCHVGAHIIRSYNCHITSRVAKCQFFYTEQNANIFTRIYPSYHFATLHIRTLHISHDIIVLTYHNIIISSRVRQSISVIISSDF